VYQARLKTQPAAEGQGQKNDDRVADDPGQQDLRLYMPILYPVFKGECGRFGGCSLVHHGSFLLFL
jgi:hypothetical protein